MKRMPLQEIVFEKHPLQRDKSGGRKRKLPVEVSCGYTSRPNGEPAYRLEFSDISGTFIDTMALNLKAN